MVKTSAEQQLLLNIVRLRYADTPSSLSVSAIAAQYELARSLAIVPFFGVGGDANPRGFVGILPSAQIGNADRPTITLTPLDDQEFTRRLFTPLPVEGILYLAKTTWQIQMVFRLYLENLNWVSNAQSASGPTPSKPPDTRTSSAACTRCRSSRTARTSCSGRRNAPSPSAGRCRPTGSTRPRCSRRPRAATNTGATRAARPGRW